MTFPPTSQAPADPTPLGYAPVLAIRRRRRIQRLLIVAAIVLVVLTAPRWARPIWWHVESAYWRGQCVSHPVPPRTIVYQSNSPAISFVSPQWLKLHATPSQLSWNWTGRTAGSTVYSGIRVASDGTKRLIVVNSGVFWVPGVSANVSIWSDQYAVGLLGSDADHDVRDVGGVSWSNGGRVPMPQPEVCIYSAVEDPQDASHFTIDFDVFVDHFVVDCRLMPGGRLRASQVSARRSRSTTNSPATASSGAPTLQ
jgi:hypothetical protein